VAKRVRKPANRTPKVFQGPVRFGVIGLGWFSQVAVLPAFAHASRNSKLAALFSSDPKKLKTLGRRYRVPALHSYDELDLVLASGQLDAVYVVLPNHLHREYTERAARAGVHVLCEKPMAVTEEDCEAMIRTTDAAGVRLMIAYRLHFDRSNLEAAEIVRSRKLGEPRIFDSVFVNEVDDQDNIRLGPIDKGGGTLYDIGVYCLNAARYLFRAEPIRVTALSANNGEKRFRKMDEMTSAILKFPGERLATFTSSFGGASTHFYQVFGTRGNLRVEPGFEFAQESNHRLTIGEKSRRKRFPKRDQVAPEILYFSDCLLRGLEPEPSGREGLADVRAIRALYQSAATGRAVDLEPFEKRSRPTLDQEIHRPPVAKRELVGVETPSSS
jgi:predicted dehydrogenase